MVWPIDDVVRLADLFINDVALSDPLSFLLFLLGALITGVTLGVLTVLTVRGVMATLSRGRSDRSPPQRG
ncbi:MAG: hypothetical protein ABEJ35_01755 [Halobacteriaceae archaeon]